MDEQTQGAILVVGGCGCHLGPGVGHGYHSFLIKTLSKSNSRSSRPMPLDRMRIGLEIIGQMALFVNNTAP